MRDRHTQPSKWARVACNVADLQPTTLRQGGNSTKRHLHLQTSSWTKAECGSAEYEYRSTRMPPHLGGERGLAAARAVLPHEPWRAAALRQAREAKTVCKLPCGRILGFVSSV